METTSLVEICAALLVLAGFISLAIPVFTFQLAPKTESPNEPETGFSIVVAFRNELNNLPALYQSICSLNYPLHLIEWIVCNDHSTDGGKAWILEVQKTSPFPITYCENIEKTGKKAALHNAVKMASHETLFFTDADCILPADLLQYLDKTIRQKNALLIAGPIAYTGNTSFLHHYQCMESAILMALTSSAFRNRQALMANGANLCMKKSCFIEAQTLRNDYNIAGGDDIFALEAVMSKHPHDCIFMAAKENMVLTRSENTWQSLLHQRTRWASKVRFQQHISGKIWQLFSLLFALTYITSICLIPFIGWTLAGILVLGKAVSDSLFMMRIMPSFSYKINAIYLPVYSAVQMFVVLYAGIRSQFGAYIWKDRKYFHNNN
jgi:cellulose synthase/poly-beta-1,6-N-acetylglucosamine synthase-like glycosyltransferase